MDLDYMITRRRFLRLSSMAGAGLLVPLPLSLGCGSNTETASTPSGPGPATIRKLPADLDKFIDPLPVPAVLKPDTSMYEGFDYYEISVSQFLQQLHSQLAPAMVWGYGESYPGPTIEARRGRPVRVRWINDDLPRFHLLAASIDPTIFRGMDYPEVRTVTHLHGGHTPPQSDGLPEAWSTPGGAERGPSFNPGDYIYPNDQQACLLWYHDHAMGITRLNVYAGLAGLYIVRDEVEEGLNLPAGDYEIPLVIHDRTLNPDGSLFYPVMGMTTIHPVWSMEFFGEIPVVNGRAYPFLDVEPRRYRFRLLNGSQSRFYNLWLKSGSGPVPFQVIGNDGGLLPNPVATTNLLLAPGERADLIVDFSSVAMGDTLTLKNDAPAPFPGGGSNVLDQLMQLRVNRPLDGEDDSTSAGQLKLPAINNLTPSPGAPLREIVLIENSDPAAAMSGMGGHQMGGVMSSVTELLLNGRHYGDPVEEKPVAGSTEIWQFINATSSTHPIHIHLVQFRILNRQPLDTEGYWTLWDLWRKGEGAAPVISDYHSGAPIPPEPWEAGWKDTARANPGEVLRVIARFDLPADTPRPARYVYHCHILEHEDNEMMRPFEVI